MDKTEIYRAATKIYLTIIGGKNPCEKDKLMVMAVENAIKLAEIVEAKAEGNKAKNPPQLLKESVVDFFVTKFRNNTFVAFSELQDYFAIKEGDDQDYLLGKFVNALLEEKFIEHSRHTTELMWKRHTTLTPVFEKGENFLSFYQSLTNC